MILSAAFFTIAWFGAVRLLNSKAHNLPLSRLIHWIHAMTFELFAFPSAALLRLIPLKEMHPGSGQPILLVHGYLHQGSVWRVQKKRLEKLGLGPIYTISLGHPFRSIGHYAEKIRVKAEMIEKETGRKDLILIGHSMGGLVSSWYATQLAPQNTVTDVITLGSPLSGTPMARIGLGENARQMEPHSPFLNQLREAVNQNKSIRFRHIATRSDQIVLPGASALYPENEHVIYEDLGHVSLLYSSRVANQIHKWVGNKN